MRLVMKAVCAISTVAIALTFGAGSANAALAVNGGVTVSCGYSQTCTGQGQEIPTVGTGGDSIDFACQAVTPYVVTATVVSCYIIGDRGDKHWAQDALTQGQVAETNASFGGTTLTSRTYQVCVGAGNFANGAYFAPTGYSCFQPLVIDSGLSGG